MRERIISPRGPPNSTYDQLHPSNTDNLSVNWQGEVSPAMLFLKTTQDTAAENQVSSAER